MLTVDKLDYNIGERQLLDKISFSIEKNERVCLLGRNGEGKTTLLHILAQRLQAEDGQIYWQPGCGCALVAQAPEFTGDGTVFDAVAEGLGDLADLVIEYHKQAARVSETPDPQALKTLQRLQHGLEAENGWQLEQRVEEVISRLRLPADVPLNTLSGGWQRRVALGRALVQQPELLILDEPTNHLDIESIEWLEQLLLNYPGAILFTTHDRSLLQKLATRILELDRGKLTSWPGDYANYLRRKEERQHEEATHQQRFDKKLAQEEVWIRQGIKARRTRDQGRVRALKAMREERRARIMQKGTAKMELGGAGQSGKLVIEASAIGKRFDDNVIVTDFSCRIQRGDRIGLLGPNGVGKTTLLQLLLGQLQPDTGTVRHGANLEIAYFDQHREQLDESRTVQENVAEGSDMVTVNGRSIHVISYLKNFLFEPDKVRGPITALSGGERNRLLLARLFTRPFNLLVMDEPTNDLDLETLEVLEDLLIEYQGTLLLVSHDRTFMDNVVTATLVFEGAGKIQAYAGGYQDWLVQRPSRDPRAKPTPKQAAGKAAKVRRGAEQARKLSYKQQRELERLPERIETLEARLAALQDLTGTPEFYQRDADEIKTTMEQIKSLQGELDIAYRRWEHLDSV